MTSTTRDELVEKLVGLRELSPGVPVGQILSSLELLIEDRTDRTLWNIDDGRLLEVIEEQRADLIRRQTDPRPRAPKPCIPHGLEFLPSGVLLDPEIPMADKEVILRLFAVARHTDRCEVRPTDLARMLGTTLRSIRKRLARLEAAEFIAVHDGWIAIHPDLIPDEVDVHIRTPLKFHREQE
jgi:CRP-like cAMP-binding protein